MARVAYLSPQPPAGTGIATYSAQVLKGLRAAGAGHRLEAPWPLGGRIDEVVDRSDLAVYHVGNNAEFHGEIYRLAVRRPGLVVLHDLAIDDLVRWFADTGDPLGRGAEDEADAARGHLFERRPEIGPPLDTPWCAHLVRRSRGVIVHSRFGAEYLEAFGTRTPAFVVPHPVIDPPRAARRAAERGAVLRARIPQSLLVGVLGDVGGPKGIEATLAAARHLGTDVAVAIVGRRIPGYEVDDAAVSSGIVDRVTVRLDVGEREFYAWLHAADVVVNLRHPHRGEVSGTLMRALEAGTPVVVQAVGTYLDWPEDSVVRIPGGQPDIAALLEALRRLQDPRERERIGAGAKREIERLRSEDATTTGYLRAIDRTLALLRDPRRDAAARWAAALAQMGGTEEHAALARSHLDALEELGEAPGVRWAGSPGRFGA
jgi:glycosyltransferase involved in cell wall biosynthesis